VNSLISPILDRGVPQEKLVFQEFIAEEDDHIAVMIPHIHYRKVLAYLRAIKSPPKLGQYVQVHDKKGFTSRAMCGRLGRGPDTT
jgi:hypothetical protein